MLHCTSGKDRTGFFICPHSISGRCTLRYLPF
ncbi:hypothetical protein ACEQPO_15625 [Bacillus sp. SL00103]